MIERIVALDWHNDWRSFEVQRFKGLLVHAKLRRFALSLPLRVIGHRLFAFSEIMFGEQCSHWPGLNEERRNGKLNAKLMNQLMEPFIGAVNASRCFCYQATVQAGCYNVAHWEL